MSKYRHTYSILIVALATYLFVCSSCAEKKKKPLDYYQYVSTEKNGLLVTKTIDDIKMELQYQPVEFKVIQDLKMEQIDRQSYQEIADKYEGLEYYSLKISSMDQNTPMLKLNLDSEEAYMARLKYFINEAQKQIRLVSENDTFPCVLYHFERTYDLTPFSHMVLAFDKAESKKQADRILIYDDQIFNIGKVKFKIKGKDIEKVPELELI